MKYKAKNKPLNMFAEVVNTCLGLVQDLSVDVYAHWINTDVICQLEKTFLNIYTVLSMEYSITVSIHKVKSTNSTKLWQEAHYFLRFYTTIFVAVLLREVSFTGCMHSWCRWTFMQISVCRPSWNELDSCVGSSTYETGIGVSSHFT